MMNSCKWLLKRLLDVLVVGGEEFPQLSQNMDSRVNLFAIVVFSSSADTFHEFVLVA